jgi:hypothetical protein
VASLAWLGDVDVVGTQPISKPRHSRKAPGGQHDRADIIAVEDLGEIRRRHVRCGQPDKRGVDVLGRG